MENEKLLELLASVNDLVEGMHGNDGVMLKELVCQCRNEAARVCEENSLLKTDLQSTFGELLRLKTYVERLESSHSVKNFQKVYNEKEERIRQIEFSREKLRRQCSAIFHKRLGELPVHKDIPRLVQRITLNGQLPSVKPVNVKSAAKLMRVAGDSLDVQNIFRIHNFVVQLAEALGDCDNALKKMRKRLFLDDGGGDGAAASAASSSSSMPSGDVTVALFQWLNDVVGADSRVVRVLKMCTQSVIAPAVVKLKAALDKHLPFNSVRNGWSIECVVSSDRVFVKHKKLEKSAPASEDIFGTFTFDWAIHFVLGIELADVKEVRVALGNVSCTRDTPEAEMLELRSCLQDAMELSAVANYATAIAERLRRLIRARSRRDKARAKEIAKRASQTLSSPLTTPRDLSGSVDAVSRAADDDSLSGSGIGLSPSGSPSASPSSNAWASASASASGSSARARLAKATSSTALGRSIVSVASKRRRGATVQLQQHQQQAVDTSEVGMPVASSSSSRSISFSLKTNKKRTKKRLAAAAAAADAAAANVERQEEEEQQQHQEEQEEEEQQQTNENESKEEGGEQKLELERIVMSRQRLTEFPVKMLEGLTKLRVLRLNHNMIDVIDRNALLDSVADPSSFIYTVTILHLNHNRLQHLPPEIGMMRALERLFLQHNELSTLPTAIGMLTNLKALNVCSNRLSELPIELCNCDMLEMIAIVDNPNMIKPPADVCSEGTQAILQHLSSLAGRPWAREDRERRRQQRLLEDGIEIDATPMDSAYQAYVYDFDDEDDVTLSMTQDVDSLSDDDSDEDRALPFE
jgi:Leucine rich repeat